MEMSIYTIMLALFAMQRDIRFHEQMCNAPTATADEQDEHGQYVLDLTRAYGEMRMMYQHLQATHPDMPPVEVVDRQVAEYCA